MFSSLSRNNKLVFLSLAMWGVGEGLWWFLLSVYIESLGANPVQIGFVLSIAATLMTLSFIPAGWLTDRVSRRLLMVIGWCMGTGSVLLLALARSWQMAIPGLILYNLSAFNMPALNSYVTAEVKPGQDMRRVFTTVFSGFTLGMLFSPAVGGWLADALGLRALFFLAAVFFAISLSLIVMIREQPIHRASGDAPAAPLSRNRPFVILIALLFVAAFVCHVGTPLAPNFLRDARGLEMSQIGLLGSANSLGGLVLVILLGRWPRSRTAGIVLAEAAVGVYALLMLTASAFPFLALAFFMRGGLGAVRQLGAARLGEVMPPASMGLGYGIFQTSINLAWTISPYVAGWLYAANAFYPFVANLGLLLPVMALTAIVASRLPAAQGRA